jgi:Transketolase-like TK C-terminal domain
VRRGDANETAHAWQAILERQSDWFSGPVGLCLTRQPVPTVNGTSAEGVARGGYVLADADGELRIMLMASGSEVQIAVEARGFIGLGSMGTPMGRTARRSLRGQRRRLAAPFERERLREALEDEVRRQLPTDRQLLRVVDWDPGVATQWKTLQA